MRDVAKLANVSIQTVSLVVNDKAGEISEETRERVLSAIQTLDYQPHAGAQSLRSGQTGNIGLLVPDAHNPHFWQYVQGVEEVAQQLDYNVFLTISDLNPATERRALRALAQQRVDGLVLIVTFVDLLERELADLMRHGNPIAGTDPRYSLDSVMAPYDVMAHVMMEHLLGLGHRRIGLIHSVGRAEDAAERVEVYHRCLADAGVPADDRLVVRCLPTVPESYAAAQKLLDIRPRPTAILAICDLAAFGAMQAALQRGLRIPEDISIAGFDDIDMSGFLTPGLTTARGHSLEAGRQLADMLIGRIADPSLPPRRVVLPGELVVRGSTGPCPVN
jgi:DNA-binding LacI/PurR family transcriptional regulator